MKSTFAFFLCLISCVSKAQTPTWSSDIANIIYNNCSSCHRNGGIGPFTLMSYTDATAHSAGILDAVTDKRMPPWKPDASYRHLKDERNLKPEDILKIQQWVAASTPAGNLSIAPAPPVFNTGSQMQGIIDKTIATLKYTVSGDVDIYRTYVIPSNNSTDKFLNEIEFVPGNNAVVHHIILFQDPSNFSDSIDKADPNPGFTSNGTMQPSPAAQYICVWAPGAGNYKLPSNMGIRIPAGADYLIEIHYAPGSNGLSDSTLVNMKYTSGGSIREVFVEPVMDWGPGSMINPTPYIPANQVKTYTQRFINNVADYSVLSVFPHMHKIGKSYKIFTTNAAGVDTTPYLFIPDWDFHWQGFYTFQKIQKFTAGQHLWGVGVYDNTSNNPDNPNNPPQHVYWGEETTDEMMVTFLAYTMYQPGDENIVLDSAGIKASVPKLKEQELISVYPNPAKTELNIQLLQTLPTSIPELIMYDWLGRETKRTVLNNTHTRVTIGELPAGVYMVRVSQPEQQQVLKFVKE